MSLPIPVQEDERNSSGGQAAGSRTDPDLVHQPQTGTPFTSPAPVAREAAGGTDGGEGRLHGGAEEWTSGPGLSSQGRGLLHATSPPQPSTLAGNGDRETLSLPEEGQNNGADTSGATHRADGSIYTAAGSHPFFEPTRAAEPLFDTSHPTTTQTDSSQRLPETQTALKYETSSTRIPNLISTFPDVPSWETTEAGSVLAPQGGAVGSTPSEALQFSWRGQRSTDRLNSEPTSTAPYISSPSMHEVASRSPTGRESAKSSSSHTEIPSTELASVAAPTSTPHHTESTSLTLRHAQSDSLPPPATDAAVQLNDTKAPDGSDDDEVLRTFTLSTPTYSPGRAETTVHLTASFTSSAVLHVAEDETGTAAPGTQSESVNTGVSTQTATSDHGRIVDTTSASVSTVTDAGPVLTIQTSATTETQTEAPLPTYAGWKELFAASLQTSSPRTTVSSSAPSHAAQTRTPPPATPVFSHTSSPSPLKTTQFAGHVTAVIHKIDSLNATVESPSSQTISSPPPSRRLPTTIEKPHYVPTSESPPVLPVTTGRSQSDRRSVLVTKEYEQGLTSSTTAQPEQRPDPRSTLQARERSPTAPTASVLPSSWSSTGRPRPKFYIVPDQPADVKGSAASNQKLA